MTHKNDGFLLKALCIFLSVLIAVCSITVCACAKEVYISDIAVATGKDGMTKLEEDGYSVLFQGMNLITDDSSIVYLGYKMGTDAITDLAVSTDKAAAAESGEIKYTLASGTNLNYGAGGTPVYLYYTKDKKAGSGIKSLDTVSGFSGTDEVLPLQNDGSSPVRTFEGKAANFDEGIDDNLLYLLMYGNDGVRQYISDACVVTGSTKAEAVNAAAAKGCDYYVDSDMSADGGVTLTAYRRTADKSDAITDIMVSGTDVKFSKSKDSSAYLIDLSAYKLFDGSFTVGDWAGIYASSDKTVTRASSAYKKLSENTDACSCVSAGASSGLYAVYLGQYSDTGLITGTEAQTEAESETEAAAGESSQASDEDLTDEFADISKEEDTVSETAEDSSESASSVFGSGSVRAILILTAIIILAIIVIFIYLKRRNGKDEKNA